MKMHLGNGRGLMHLCNMLFNVLKISICIFSLYTDGLLSYIFVLRHVKVCMVGRYPLKHVK